MVAAQPPEGLRKIAREAAALPPCRHWLPPELAEALAKVRAKLAAEKEVGS